MDHLTNGGRHMTIGKCCVPTDCSVAYRSWVCSAMQRNLQSFDGNAARVSLMKTLNVSVAVVLKGGAGSVQPCAEPAAI